MTKGPGLVEAGPCPVYRCYFLTMLPDQLLAAAL